MFSKLTAFGNWFLSWITFSLFPLFNIKDSVVQYSTNFLNYNNPPTLVGEK